VFKTGKVGSCSTQDAGDRRELLENEQVSIVSTGASPRELPFSRRISTGNSYALRPGRKFGFYISFVLPLLGQKPDFCLNNEPQASYFWRRFSGKKIIQDFK
jgi:hypothetical protein